MLKKSGIHLEVMWIKGSFFCRHNTPPPIDTQTINRLFDGKSWQFELTKYFNSNARKLTYSKM